MKFAPLIPFILLLSGSAFGSPEYPALVRDELGMSCTPACTVCHETNAGGAKTLVAFSANAYRKAGLRGANPESVPQALDSLTSLGADTDGDGTGDIDELIAGNDPNGGGSACGSKSTGGCQLVVTPTASTLECTTPSVLAVGAALAACLGFYRRSMRKMH